MSSVPKGFKISPTSLTPRPAQRGGFECNRDATAIMFIVSFRAYYSWLMCRFSLDVLLLFVCAAGWAQKPQPPSSDELAAIAARGKLLYEYDQAELEAIAVDLCTEKTAEKKTYVRGTPRMP
jgi:hypothetical protein